MEVIQQEHDALLNNWKRLINANLDTQSSRVAGVLAGTSI